MTELETEQTIETQKKDSSVPKKSSETLGMGPSHIASLYSGPIPPPDYLARYENMVPGSAKRFLEEPHLEAEHRRSLERKMVEAQIQLGKRGQMIACGLASACVIGSFTAIFSGHSILGLSTLFVSIAAFIGVFIYGKSHKSK